MLSVDFIFLILAQVCFAAAILFKLNLFSMNAYVLAEILVLGRLNLAEIESERGLESFYLVEILL